MYVRPHLIQYEAFPLNFSKRIRHDSCQKTRRSERPRLHAWHHRLHTLFSLPGKVPCMRAYVHGSVRCCHQDEEGGAAFIRGQCGQRTGSRCCHQDDEGRHQGSMWTAHRVKERLCRCLGARLAQGRREAAQAGWSGGRGAVGGARSSLRSVNERACLGRYCSNKWRDRGQR